VSVVDTQSRVAIVTGAASGIGRGIATRLNADGYRVVIADINEAAAQAVANEFEAGSGEPGVIGVAMDVRSEASVAGAMSAVIERWGRVDVLCANAGVYPGAAISEISGDDWDFVQNVNLRGAFFCLKQVAPHMRERGFGRIILTSSVTGAITGFPGWTHYGASKAGLLGMMRSAALELIADGITVNAVMPGNVRTPAWNDLPVDYLEKTARAIPIGRLAEPSDIANGVAFFADERSSYITGQTLVIDGGQVLPEIPMN
jgi:3-oxoacyl-[acyl-carrier protein] reductase